MEPYRSETLSTNRKTLLYGPPGVGKSTAAAQADRAIFIPTEDGLGSIKCDRFPLCKSYEDYKKALQWLATNDHSFKTVVTDSADWLEALVWANICRKGGKEAITDFDWGKGYGKAATELHRILAKVDEIREEKGIHFVFIAHSKIERYEDPDSAGYDRYQMKLDKRAAPILMEWADEVLFCNIKARARDLKDNDGGTIKTVAKADGRSIICTGRPSAVAKNRLGMPDEIPMAWKEYEKFFKAPVGSTDK